MLVITTEIMLKHLSKLCSSREFVTCTKLSEHVCMCTVGTGHFYTINKHWKTIYNPQNIMLCFCVKGQGHMK